MKYLFYITLLYYNGYNLLLYRISKIILIKKFHVLEDYILYFTTVKINLN